MLDDDEVDMSDGEPPGVGSAEASADTEDTAQVEGSVHAPRTSQRAQSEDRAPVPRAAVEPSVAGGELLWLATQGRPWRSLAIVPASDGIDSYNVARFIAESGRRHGQQVDLADLRDLALERVAPVATLLLGGPDRLIVALSSIQENVATVSFSRAVDGVILCASLGSTTLDSIEDALFWIGKDRFVGTVLVRAPGSVSNAVARGSAAAWRGWGSEEVAVAQTGAVR